VWLDDLPIATLRPSGTGTPQPVEVYYVHADHLGSPRAVTRPLDDTLVWWWEIADPYGNNAADVDPSGLGAFFYYLRAPGQQYDVETNTTYNYFRDYSAVTGRYEQSDPIGLLGGINSYAYVSNKPLAHSDERGLLGSRGNPHALEGCGPNGKLIETFIPDNPLGFVFRSCCDGHDKCYDDCLSNPTKEACDQDFLDCMITRCLRYAGGQRRLCEYWSKSYYGWVTSDGYEQFIESRNSCARCR
jgi:RHS repeat-associated protein